MKEGGNDQSKTWTDLLAAQWHILQSIILKKEKEVKNIIETESITASIWVCGCERVVY